MILLMIRGHDDDPSHTRFDAYDAGKSVGYSLRAVRSLLDSDVFTEALWQAERGDDLSHDCLTLQQVRELQERKGRIVRERALND